MLLRDPADIYCQKIKVATDGMGTDQNTLSRIIGGHDKIFVRDIASRYKSKYNVDLNTLLKKELGDGDYSNAVLTWVNGSDPTGNYVPTAPPAENQPTADIIANIDTVAACIERMKDFTASLDADLLKRAAKGVGTDERMVVNVLCTRTKAQIDRIDLMYRQKYGRTLKEYIEREMGGNLKKFLSYAQMAEDGTYIDKYLYFFKYLIFFMYF